MNSLYFTVLLKKTLFGFIEYCTYLDAGAFLAGILYALNILIRSLTSPSETAWAATFRLSFLCGFKCLLRSLSLKIALLNWLEQMKK